MFRPIQTATAGFLSLLGLKNLGRNPDTILGEVRPAVDMNGWWLRGASEPYYQEEVLTAAAQAVDFLVVPPNEWVYFHYGFGFLFTPTPNQSDAINLLVVKDNATQLIWTTPLQFVQQASGGTPAATAMLPEQGLWVPPGFTMRLNCYGTIGDTAGLGGLITRVRV